LIGERAFLIYPGKDDYPLDRRITAWPAARIPALAHSLAA
jgi:hypothetical protein